MTNSLAQKLEEAALQDAITVMADGKTTARMIEGVRIREAVLHTDDRGTLCEMYDPRWGFHPDPLVYVYFSTIRPGFIKGWAMHKIHEDRYFLLAGEMKLVLYDTREDSPTHGLVREVYLTENRRQLISIPTGVWHADENVGSKDCVIVNMPTHPFDHANPDKYRLPLDTDLIPYKFQNAKGY